MSDRPRSQFKVIVIPYWFSKPREARYALFRRSGTGPAYWQWIAGGGESGETPLQTARRESAEEAGISESAKFTALKSMASIPVSSFAETGWPECIDVIPEYAFAVEVEDPVLTLSGEHVDYRWLGYEESTRTLKWDSNKTALWELRRRLIRGGRMAPPKTMDTPAR